MEGGEAPKQGIEYRTTENSVKAIEGGKEVGKLQLSFTPTGRAVIVDVGISREYQRRGVGGRLTELAEQVASERGASEIGAIAQPDYLKMLEKKGYNVDGFFATKKLEPRR